MGGGNIASRSFERFSSKNYLSQWSITFWKFLNMYVFWLQTKIIVICTLTGVLRGVSNLLVKIILCIFWTYLHFFWVLFIFYHVRCLNILNFGHWFHFWGQKKIWSTLTVVLFRSDILAMFYRSFYISRERAPVSMRTILNVWMRST